MSENSPSITKEKPMTRNKGEREKEKSYTCEQWKARINWGKKIENTHKFQFETF